VTNQNIEKYLTVREFAEYLRVTPSTVKRWIKNKKVSAIRVGKRGDWRIEEKELKRILK